MSTLILEIMVYNTIKENQLFITFKHFKRVNWNK